jgi:hypothetical protein
MRRAATVVGLVLPLALAACPSTHEWEVAGPPTPIEWDETCGCWVYWDDACGCWMPSAAALVARRLADGFEDGVLDTRWTADGDVALDALQGDPAPSVSIGAPGGALTTVDPVSVSPGLEIGVSARIHGPTRLPGSATIEVTDAATGVSVASADVALRADGTAVVAYRIVSAASIHERVEVETVGAVDSPFRRFVLTFAGGDALWTLDGGPRLAAAVAPATTAIRLTLSAASADVRYDSVNIEGSP